MRSRFQRSGSAGSHVIALSPRMRCRSNACLRRPFALLYSDQESLARLARRPTWISGAVGGELAEREEFVDGFVYADGEEVAVWDGFAVGVDAKESAVVDRGHAD